MSGESLLSRLRALRRRLIAQAMAERLARSGIVVLAAALLLSVMQAWWKLPIAWGIFVPTAAILACGWALGATAARAPSCRAVAELLDRLGSTRDRWTSVLAFLSMPADPTREAALQECAAYLGSRDFRPLLPWRIPRAFTWSIVPLIAIAFLQWQVRDERIAAEHEASLAQEEVAPRVAQLEALARVVEQVRQVDPSGELEKLAEELRRSVGNLRGEATDRTAASKAALRELSRLEQLLREMQQSPAQLSQEELDALAKALEQPPETAGVADALKQGRTVDAAKALEQAAQELAARNDQPATQQTEEMLRQAMERLAQQRQISDALREMARQLSQRVGQGSAGQMLQQLAQMLRESRAGQGAQARKPETRDSKSAQQLFQKTLAALQNMKHGERPGKPPASGAQGENDGQVLVQSFGQPDGENAFAGAMMAPSGTPGSERDSGTTENPFGNERSEIADKGGEMALRGELGEGETLSQLLPAAGGDDKARRRYKEIYEAMAPAAEDSVLQEDIPLGSRFLIKRYFESIRP